MQSSSGEKENYIKTKPLLQELEKVEKKNETVPKWLRDTVKIISDAWFDPKSFEQILGFYEKFGIRTFKKYIPTGDLALELALKKMGEPPLDFCRATLSRRDTYTRILEVFHLATFNIESGIFAAQLAQGDTTSASFTMMLNVIVNVYPIMLQRYNRVRIYRLMYAMKKRQNVE